LILAKQNINRLKDVYEEEFTKKGRAGDGFMEMRKTRDRFGVNADWIVGSAQDPESRSLQCLNKPAVQTGVATSLRSVAIPFGYSGKAKINQI
jgi:hypothetical protein